MNNTDSTTSSHNDCAKPLSDIVNNMLNYDRTKPLDTSEYELRAAQLREKIHNSSISGSHVSTTALASKHHQISAFANKGSYSNKALKKARSKALAKELVVEPVVSDKSYREDQLVKRFLANVRILRNYKPKDKEQHLKRSLNIVKAISEVYFFLNQNYFKDNNKEFNLYLAITDKNYVKSYMSNFSINDKVRNLYFKPRNIEIIYNTETFKVEAVFNSKEFVDLFYGSTAGPAEAFSVLTHICDIRSFIEKDYAALVKDNDGVYNEQDMQNICVAHIARAVVNEPDAAMAQWILDKGIALTVQDFVYVYTTPHCMRTLAKSGLSSVDLDANPHKYNAEEHEQLRRDSETHVFDDNVTIHHD